MTWLKAPSPWTVQAPETLAEKHARLSEDGHTPFERSVTFNGPSHSLTVVFPTFETKPETVNAMSCEALGRAVEDIVQACKPAVSVLMAQGISQDRSALTGPVVQLNLGALCLWAKASSNDLRRAVTYAIDRLAAVLLELSRFPEVQRLLVQHNITIARSAKV